MTLRICKLCEATSAGVLTRFPNSRSLICSWCTAELTKRGAAFCRRCQQARPSADFKPSNPRYCRQCRADTAAPRRAANAACKRAQRAADPALRERDRLRVQAWRDSHPAKSKAAAARRYQRFRDAKLAYQRAYYRAHRDAVLARMRRRSTEYHRMHRIRRKLRILRGAWL